MTDGGHVGTGGRHCRRRCGCVCNHTNPLREIRKLSGVDRTGNNSRTTGGCNARGIYGGCGLYRKRAATVNKLALDRGVAVCVCEGRGILGIADDGGQHVLLPKLPPSCLLVSVWWWSNVGCRQLLTT